MTTPMTTDALQGRDVVDPDGEKIGTVAQVYLDDQTDEPTFVAVKGGLFGARQHFVPLHGASTSGSDLVVAVSKDIVKAAPSVDDAGHIDESEQTALYDYYANYIGTGRDTQASGLVENFDAQGAGHDTSGPNTDTAMTRSEEQLRVGTERVEAGRARLRKYVVTENVTTTVPVSHEEVRVEREPITDANRAAAMDGPAISEEEHEVTLHAERPVVATEAVPVERVRLATETVTENETVSADVRKERIDEVGTDPDATVSR
jgi:uncharacterized protein (TIGR02271 family)